MKRDKITKIIKKSKYSRKTGKKSKYSRKKNQKGGDEVKCDIIYSREDNILRKPTKTQAELDIKKILNENPDIGPDDVIVTPQSTVFDKRYKDTVNNSTQPGKDLATDINSFAMYASHELFSSYYKKMKGEDVTERRRQPLNLSLPGQLLHDDPIWRKIRIYERKRTKYITYIETNPTFQGINDGPDYHWENVTYSLDKLTDFREVVMRPYRIINEAITKHNNDNRYLPHQKIYFVFKGGLSLKYMLESLIADIQCHTGTTDNTDTKMVTDTNYGDLAKICNETRQLKFNEPKMVDEIEHLVFETLTKDYIGQDAEKAYFKASDFDTGIYINPETFSTDYTKVASISLRILMDQKEVFDMIWKYNVKNTEPLLSSNNLDLDLDNYIRKIFVTKTKKRSFRQNSFLPKDTDRQAKKNAINARNLYYKMCVDLFLDRLRIITDLERIFPILCDYDKNTGEVTKKGTVTEKHLEFLKLFDYDKIHDTTTKQLFNDVNISFLTGEVDIDKTKFISPITKYKKKYPLHPMQNILYKEYAQNRTGQSLRGIPKNSKTKKIAFNSGEFREQCIDTHEDKIFSFWDFTKRKTKKSPYYISNNDSINLQRISEQQEKILEIENGTDRSNWPTSNTTFGLIRTKLNYKLIMRYKLGKHCPWQDYVKDAPGEMIDISIPRPSDMDINSFYNDKSAMNIAKYKYITMINGINTLNLNYIVKDTLTMLGHHNICPWSDPKYKKRLHRLFIVVLFKYILKSSIDRTAINLETWRTSANSYIKPISDKLVETNLRSCASYLFQEEDEPLNQLETVVIKEWNKRMNTQEYKEKTNSTRWENLKRTFNLKLYIRELLDNWGNAQKYIMGEQDDLEFLFNQLVYKTALEWTTWVVKRLNVDKKDKIKVKKEYDILQYLFLVQDKTGIIEKQPEETGRNHNFIPRETLLNTIRKSMSSEKLKIDNYVRRARAYHDALPRTQKLKGAITEERFAINEGDRLNKIINKKRDQYKQDEEQQIYYRKVRTYLSQYRTFGKEKKEDETKALEFQNNLNKIITDIYNKYINPGELVSRIQGMNIEVARVLFNKYFSNDNNPLETIRTYRGGKTIRKHRGIHQTGGSAGKLKKGYKYSGKKLKNGKAEIIKVKKIKKIKKN
jgi:hypothetical protein